MKEVEENNIQKPVRPMQLEAINLSEFLPSDLSKEELDEIMTRSGIEDPTSEESVKFLLLAFSENPDLKNRLSYYGDIKKLSPEIKKRLGREFISALKAHPVIGTVEGEGEEAQKMRAIDNVAWYGKIMKNLMKSAETLSFPKSESMTSTENLKKLKDSKFGDYTFLSDRFMKLSKKWRSRDGRNISTKDNPYGIDRCDAFIAGFSNELFHTLPGNITNSTKGNNKNFLQSINCYTILQTYNMVMDRILSEKTDLKQKAYLKLLLETNIQDVKFKPGSDYTTIIKNVNGMALFQNYLTKGKYNKVLLDIDFKDNNNLPEKYEYFNTLSEEECNTILNTPYSELSDDLKKKAEKLMPSVDDIKNKYENYHKGEISEGLIVAYSNNNSEVFDLDILNTDKIDDLNEIEKLTELEKRAISDTFNLVMAPVLMEEMMTEYQESEAMSLLNHTKSRKADISSHFIIRRSPKENVYADGSTSQEEFNRKQNRGYSADEIIQMKLRVLREVTKEKTLAYRRYQNDYVGSTNIAPRTVMWKVATKPDKNRQAMKKPVVEEKAAENKEIEKPVVKEQPPVRPEEKKEEEKKEEEKKEEEKKEEEKKEEEKKEEEKKEEKKEEKPVIKEKIEENKIEENKNINFDDGNRINNFDDDNKINNDINNKDNEIKTEEIIDQETPEEGIVEDGAGEEEDIKERERLFKESVENYTSALSDMDKINALVIYSNEFLGCLRFRDEIHKDNNEAVSELKEKLQIVASLSDETSPADAKGAISELGTAMNNYLLYGAGLKNKVIKRNCKELTSFKESVDKAINGMKLDTEEMSYREIMQNEYKEIYKKTAKVTRKDISESAENQNKKLIETLKLVKEQYKILQSCNKHPQGNSVQFNEMFEAAGKAAALSVDSSPIEIKNIMGQLRSTTATYMKKINERGGGIIGAGKKKGFYRLESAKDLYKIARSAFSPFDKMTYPYDSFKDQVKPEFQNVKTHKKTVDKKTISKANNNNIKA